MKSLDARLAALVKEHARRRPVQRAERPVWTPEQGAQLERDWAALWQEWSPAQRGAILHGWDPPDLWQHLDALTPAERAHTLDEWGLPDDFSRDWRPASERDALEWGAPGSAG